MLLFGYFFGKTDLRDRCHQQKDNYCNCGNKVDDEQLLKQTHSFLKSCEITVILGHFGTWQVQMYIFQRPTKIMIRMFMKIMITFFSVSFCQLEHLLWSSSISWQLLDWNQQNKDNPPDHHRSGFWSAPSGKLITAAEKPKGGKHLGTLQNTIIIIIPQIWI